MKTIIPNVTIQSVAAWLPKNKYSCISFCDQYGEKEVKEIIKATGAENIYRADEGEKASDLCYNAAEFLLNKEEVDRSSIDGLVYVSATRDWIQPDTSISLQHRLGLSTETVCQDINYGCAGFIFGLLQASSWIHCGMCKKVLVLAGEVLTPFLNPNSAANIEVSEAGTAAIITAGESDFAIHISSNGAKSEKIVLPFDGHFFQDGMTVFTYGIATAPKSIKAVMELKGWEEPDVDMFALHQSNKMIIKSIRMSLKSSAEKFPMDMDAFGNTSSSTVPLLLCDLYGGKDVEQPKHAILCAYGVGLTCASAAVDLSNTHFYEPQNRQ